jgi:hypothetical protein
VQLLPKLTMSVTFNFNVVCASSDFNSKVFGKDVTPCLGSVQTRSLTLRRDVIVKGPEFTIEFLLERVGRAAISSLGSGPFAMVVFIAQVADLIYELHSAFQRMEKVIATAFELLKKSQRCVETLAAAERAAQIVDSPVELLCEGVPAVQAAARCVAELKLDVDTLLDFYQDVRGKRSARSASGNVTVANKLPVTPPSHTRRAAFPTINEAGYVGYMNSSFFNLDGVIEEVVNDTSATRSDGVIVLPSSSALEVSGACAIPNQIPQADFGSRCLCSAHFPDCTLWNALMPIANRTFTANSVCHPAICHAENIGADAPPVYSLSMSREYRDFDHAQAVNTRLLLGQQFGAHVERVLVSSVGISSPASKTGRGVVIHFQILPNNASASNVPLSGDLLDDQWLEIKLVATQTSTAATGASIIVDLALGMMVLIGLTIVAVGVAILVRRQPQEG